MDAVDGLTVGKKVRDYFDAMRGPGAIWDFVIATQVFGDSDKKWHVACSFRSSPQSTAGVSYRYQVEVSQEGQILQIMKTAEEKVRS